MVAALLLSAAGCGGMMPRQYEYEEEMYLDLDGTATVYVNASVPALIALRGIPLDARPTARLDRAAIRAAYSSAVTRVTRVSSWRRGGRRFVHVRVDVYDVRRLSEAAPFAWSSYALARDHDTVTFKQRVEAPSGRPLPEARWTGAELVAFRLHLPSKIQYHDAPSRQVERGNILVWEQSLTDRLRGRPVSLEVRLDTQSILYRTLWLFGVMIVVVAAMFAAVIWWIVRKGHASEAARVS
jgi:hypothetical protein